MKSNFIYILVAIAIVTFFLIQQSENNTSHESMENSTHSSNTPIHFIDFYNLYYALLSKELIGNPPEKDKIKDILSKVKIGDLIRDNDTTNLVNIWYYVEISKQYDHDLKFQKEIINYLKDYQLNEGPFVLDLNDKRKIDTQNPNDNMSIILPTVMTIDIFKSFKEPIPKIDSINTWLLNTLKENSNITENTEEQEGSYLYMLLDLAEKLGLEEKINFNDYIKNYNSNFENNANLSLERIDTFFNLNELKNIESYQNIFNDKTAYEYIRSLQLENGSFKFEGSEPDILATYLSIKNINRLNKEVPSKDNTNGYLEEVIEDSLPNQNERSIEY
ncbi:hypothetical protein [Metabacillus arenae]|uniref:Uncharacterized protein n=1 Tax=Metabacillus arenae TaxID=2771434 RepID=A0A926NMS6_9BACI|nr:hypothetical protein [Metabacillus arenae]MBD1383580.1 hypothetical protein [Metabacillus arenae]